MLILLAMGCISACKHQDHIQHEASTYVATSPVVKDTLIFHEYVSQIHSIQHIELRTLEKGFLQKIFVDEGQIVKKGQLLFQILPIINEAEVLKAKAEADYAEIEFLNTKSLSDGNVVSVNELALAKARLDKAKAELALAQAHLSFTEIRAPFEGIVGRFRDVRLGSLLDEGELLTTLSDNSKMWVYFNVPEAEYLNFVRRDAGGQPRSVKLKLANNDIFEQEGQVETIEADFNNETGNIAFRATFPNPEGMLRNGQTGNILMPVILKDALLIPQKSTFEILDRKFVYVIDEGDQIQSREISVGAELEHIYEVKTGLKASEKVLVEGLRKVKNGQHVAYDFHEQSKLWAGMKNLHAE